MADFLSPGTKVTQVRKGPIVLPSIATAISGFLVYTQKGPVGRAVLVTSPEDAKEVFGDRITSPGNSRLTDTLIDYFGEGGASAYVVRYIGSGSASGARNMNTVGGAVAGSMSSSAASFPAALAAGDTFIGKVDGLANQTATINATRATKTGAAATYATVTASNSLDVTISGIPGVQIITFAGTENTQALFLAAINSQIRGARAVDAGGQVRLETDILGSSASGVVEASTDADVLVSLGLTTGAFTNAGPNNVATVDAVTAAELKLIFDAAFTNGSGSTSTANANGSLTWASNTTGASSSVQMTGGTGQPKVPGFAGDTTVHSGSATTSVPTVTLSAAEGTYPSPGSWVNSYSSKATKVNSSVTTVAATAAGSTTSIVVASSARLAIGDTVSITQGGDTQRGIIQLINGTTVTFVAAITVPGGGYLGTESVVLETWELTIYNEVGAIVFPSPFRNLRMSSLAGSNYFVNAINSAARTPVNATNLSASAADPRPNTDTSPVLFTGGSDGSAPTATNVTDQISAFNQVNDVSFISSPGANTDFSGSNGVTILTALANYAATRNDVLAIMSTPRGTPATGSGGAKDYTQNTLNVASSYAAIYWPWVKSLDAVSNTVIPFPPEPHVQGVIARVHKNRNFGKAPAGIIDGLLQSRVVDLETNIKEQSAEYDDMYPANVNALLKFPGEGFAIFGSRTLDPTGEFGQINVQVVFNVNKRLVKQKTRFVVFENNDPTTRNAVVRVLTATFRDQRLAGILQGEKDSEAFFIICDESNNTPLVINKGKLACRIGLAVQRPSEFLDFTFELDTRAADAALASITG